MKAIFTTGEAAQLCKVSQQTIIRCFDSGRLKGFRVPGSRFRRIPRSALMTFIRENGIPADDAPSGRRRVLVVGAAGEIADSLTRNQQLDVRLAATAYEAGMATQEFLPELIVLGPMSSDAEELSICQTIKRDPALQHIRIVVAGPHTTSQTAQLREHGCEVLPAGGELPGGRITSQLAEALA